ncbi:hypothetical protein AB0D49_03515 [Streptomyces sp. NPDC048290]|uniref:hypothetical protein n=1 Tax=Streptomyces sp. NPDC048290 TaxID=3155811 RepID=UPI00342666E0
MIILGWLVGFLVVDVSLRVSRWWDGRRDRVVIRQIMADGVSPVQAAFQRAHWMPHAAEVALAGLLADGVAQVSDDGLVTVEESAPLPVDPTLRALAEALRDRAEPTPLYEVASEPEFEAFRRGVLDGAPPLKRYNGSQRTGLIWFGFLISLGTGLHGGLAGAPAPGGIEEAEFWAAVPLFCWPVLCLWAALTWPGSFTPRWPDFERYCAAVADAVLARTPPRDLAALRLHRIRPRPPEPTRAASGERRGGDDVLDWGGDADGGGGDGE